MTAKKGTMIRTLVWVLLATLGVACSEGQRHLFPDGGDIFGLASPIELSQEETLVVLTDYFHPDVIQKIDSVRVHAGLNAKITGNGTLLSIQPRSMNIPHLSEVIIWLEGKPYSILARKANRELFTFTYDPQGRRHRSVAVRGEISDWTPVPMTLIDGLWQVTLSLNPGRYQYLIVADGRDMLDPANPEKVSNNAGGYNSLVEVGQLNRSLLPSIYATSAARNEIVVQLVNDVEEVFVLWQNFRLPMANLVQQGKQLKIRIPADARAHQRSFLRIVATNPHGVSNDLLIPLQNGAPLMDPSQITRQDREATILYFLMVDRFFNGNPDRDDPIMDPEVAPRANYHGGDLDGVLQKIREGYFSELGVNAVWFSPITQNPLEAYVEFPQPKRKYTGYHGYWPITLTTIDHRFGDDQVLEDLVKEAHERGMSVLLDFVSNHVHINNPLIAQNPDWATTLNLPDGRQNIRIWDEHRLTTWFDDFLPTLDFSKPEVVQTMVDSAFFWIDRFNLDGFRHDATKHVPLEFWRALTLKLKTEKMFPENNRLFQIGETFGSRELIGSYVGSGLLDGQFDFNLYWDARSVFALDDVSFERLDFSLHQSFAYYGFQNLMGNITGNHDMPRFISYAGGGLRFDEDATAAGWEREVGVGDPKGYKKLSALTAFTLTIPGIPVIYYGDEIGIPGANDPDSRRPMIFEDLTDNQREVKENLKKLTRLRSENLALIYGDFNTLLVTDELYAYARSYFGNRVVVVFNKSNQPRSFTVDLPPHFSNVNYLGHFSSDYRMRGNKLEITLPGYSFDVFTF